MLICDSHTHTEYSFDSEAPIEEMVQTAIKNGIDVYTITDHCDAIGIDDPNNIFGVNLLEVIPQSVKRTQELAQKYQDKITLLTGVELGEPTHNLDKTNKALTMADYDFVLASTHEVRGREDFYFLKYTEENIDTLMTEYFNEQIEIVNWNKFDSLAHFDYPVRYIAERTNITVDYKKYDNIITEILTILIKNNKSLEVNTSTFRKPLTTSLPNEYILQKYKDLGGYLITLGSDAHQKDYVGKDLQKGIELLKKVGFTSYCYYKKHNPIQVNFD